MTKDDPAPPAAFPADPDETAGLPATADGGTTRFLTKLLTLTPFLDLDDRAGDYSVWRRRICFALDMAVRVVVVAVLLGIIAGVAWKALAPLPHLQTGS